MKLEDAVKSEGKYVYKPNDLEISVHSPGVFYVFFGNNSWSDYHTVTGVKQTLSSAEKIEYCILRKDGNGHRKVVGLPIQGWEKSSVSGDATKAYWAGLVGGICGLNVEPDSASITYAKWRDRGSSVETEAILEGFVAVPGGPRVVWIVRNHGIGIVGDSLPRDQFKTAVKRAITRSLGEKTTSLGKPFVTLAMKMLSVASAQIDRR